VNGESSTSGSTVWIRSQNEDLIFEVRYQSPSLGDRGDEQRRLTYCDGFTTSLAMSSGVFNGCFDQRTRRSLADRTTGEVGGQLEIEVIDAIRIRLAGC
jgi:hypothetical protein